MSSLFRGAANKIGKKGQSLFTLWRNPNDERNAETSNEAAKGTGSTGNLDNRLPDEQIQASAGTTSVSSLKTDPLEINGNTVERIGNGHIAATVDNKPIGSTPTPSTAKDIKNSEEQTQNNLNQTDDQFGNDKSIGLKSKRGSRNSLHNRRQDAEESGMKQKQDPDDLEVYEVFNHEKYLIKSGTPSISSDRNSSVPEDIGNENESKVSDKDDKASLGMDFGIDFNFSEFNFADSSEDIANKSSNDVNGNVFIVDSRTNASSKSPNKITVGSKEPSLPLQTSNDSIDKKSAITKTEPKRSDKVPSQPQVTYKPSFNYRSVPRRTMESKTSISPVGRKSPLPQRKDVYSPSHMPSLYKSESFENTNTYAQPASSTNSIFQTPGTSTPFFHANSTKSISEASSTSLPSSYEPTKNKDIKFVETPDSTSPSTSTTSSPVLFKPTALPRRFKEENKINIVPMATGKVLNAPNSTKMRRLDNDDQQYSSFHEGVQRSPRIKTVPTSPRSDKMNFKPINRETSVHEHQFFSKFDNVMNASNPYRANITVKSNNQESLQNNLKSLEKAAKELDQYSSYSLNRRQPSTSTSKENGVSSVQNQQASQIQMTVMNIKPNIEQMDQPQAVAVVSKKTNQQTYTTTNQVTKTTNASDTQNIGSKKESNIPYNRSVSETNDRMPSLGSLDRKTLIEQNRVKNSARYSVPRLGAKDERLYSSVFDRPKLTTSASSERNIHVRADVEVERSASAKNISGWCTLGRAYGQRHSGFYAEKKVDILRTHEEVQRRSSSAADTAYSYSSDTSEGEDTPCSLRYPDQARKRQNDNRHSAVEEVTEEEEEIFVEPQTKELIKKPGMNIAEYLSTSISGIYGICLIVCGIVVPLSETFADPNQPFVFEAFYVYLYLVSILFLVYVYLFLLRERHLNAKNLVRTVKRSLSRASQRELQSNDTERGKTFGDKIQGKVRRHVSMNPVYHTGSFYLRLGAVFFGVGSMIHSGLHFGRYFQSFEDTETCSQPMQAVKPFCHLVFTFVQLYFIFLNSKMCVNNYKVIARFGMMHMCGTNICVWFRVLVIETLGVLQNWNKTRIPEHILNFYFTGRLINHTIPSLQVINSTSAHYVGENAFTKLQRNITSIFHIPADMICLWDNMMGGLLEKTAPYLYPCTIQYSLICTGILYVMWKNVGKGGNKDRESDEGISSNEHDQKESAIENRKRNKIHVDCAHSSRGLFTGILVSVGAIVVMIAFYVMVHQKEEFYQRTAVIMVHLSETTMYVLTTMASIFAMERMSKLKQYHTERFGLEECLILVSYSGIAMFGMFSLICAIHSLNTIYGVAVILTNICMLLQSSMQTVLVFAAKTMYAGDKDQQNKRPGREFITFLILCNFSLWIINTFEIRTPEHNPLQFVFYGHLAWPIFTHISVPLCIFFRFHSSIYLCNIWKNAWKTRQENSALTDNWTVIFKPEK